MSPKTKQQYEEIRKSSKGRIMSVALKLFAEKGYHATSISQIASKAKVSKGLMYNYFSSKEDLLDEIIEQGFSALAKLEYLIQKGRKPEEQLENFIDSVINNLFSNFTYWQLYLTLLVHPSVQKRYEKRLKAFRDDFTKTLSALFKDLGSINPRLEAFILGTFFDGLVLNFIAAEDEFPIEKIKQTLVKKFIEQKSEKR